MILRKTEYLHRDICSIWREGTKGTYHTTYKITHWKLLYFIPIYITEEIVSSNFS